MNSREFTDFPAARRRPCRSHSHFALHARGDPRGATRFAEGPCHTNRRGWPRFHPCEAEILRFTAAFLRGLGSFSPSDITAHPPWFLRRFYRTSGADPATDIGFRRSPFPASSHSLTGGGSSAAPNSEIPSRGSVQPRSPVAKAPWTPPPDSRQASASFPILPVYRWRRNPSRALPFGALSAIAGRLPRDAPRSLVYQRGGCDPLGGDGRRPVALLSRFPIPEVPGCPVLSSLLAARVHRRWRSRSAREPFRGGLLPRPSQAKVSSFASPFGGNRQAGGSSSPTCLAG